MTRAQAKERNRRALLDSARQVVARDGHRARLEEIAEQAGLTTGAVYSLFGSKDGLLIALLTDYLGPHYEDLEQAVPPGLGLADAVGAFARRYRRLCDDPDARRHLSFEISMQDMALRDPGLGPRFAASVRAHEERLTALFAGRAHDGAVLTPRQARRLATALRGLLIGLSQGVVLGLIGPAPEPGAPGPDTSRPHASDPHASRPDTSEQPTSRQDAGEEYASERYFADAARALVTPPVLGPP
ncbi:TetR/AcrR family transcriptional regulator [Nonomuraea rhodomycinica]|uniref:TetR/AcrR family transcriptional regulator n=1 Tax=Nonomuraea rhodomycinica TaxID=1712872 RepID=A0A7Y6MH59_9ACTN|nr:TetR/AcrR family transcriptional regulator [Nonomuraea rhodomycinica]NUW46835.1 TetR/AcrR family transcriptional regulator [Nonomuraea rhodomycinica]